MDSWGSKTRPLGTTLGPYSVTAKIGQGGMLRHEHSETVRNYTKDEGRPFGAARQGETPNHLKLLRSKAVVVSVEEKAHRMCQVGTRKMSASEPRVTRRNFARMVSKPGLHAGPGMSSEDACLPTERCPAYTWHEPGSRSLCGRGNSPDDPNYKRQPQGGDRIPEPSTHPSSPL